MSTTDNLTSGDGVVTLPEALRYHAIHTPERLAYRFLHSSSDFSCVDELTYEQLDVRVQCVAAAMADANLCGERTLLLFEPGLDYIVGFLACLTAGAIAVPAYPPRKKRQTNSRLHSIIADCTPKAVLMSSVSSEFVRQFAADLPLPDDAHWIGLDEIRQCESDPQNALALKPQGLAFIQYTSGSTGMPKGVCITHRNLATNAVQIAQAMGTNAETRGMSWLPPYHDMGLIGGILQTLWYGAESTLMAPAAFLQNPVGWLRAIAHFRTDISGGPNFAYDLCVEKASVADLSGLDLSCWRIAFNGSEPIRSDTLTRFVDCFKHVGFRHESVFPCYGLAEGTLLVSGGSGRAPVQTLNVDAQALEALEVKLVDAGTTLVSSGVAAANQSMIIVDPESRTLLPDSRVGEIWIRGPQVADGYWADPKLTQEIFGNTSSDSAHGDYMRTGDFGFLHDQQLYITGRLKDLIVLNGRNLWPQDIEHATQDMHPAVRAAGVVAFPVTIDDRESFAVLCEVRPHKLDLEQTALQIVEGIAAEFQAVPAFVALVRQRSLARTSSGKIQRRETRRRLMAGELTVFHSTREISVAQPAPVLTRATPVTATQELAPSTQNARTPSLSVMFFASDGEANQNVYGLFQSVVDYADSHEFEAVWIPERHFHQFGGPFPNPAILAASVATSTQNIKIRAGSVVLPLHDPLRVAEEWGMVDRLSSGRTGLAFATGWNPNDFVLSPERYDDRVTDTLDNIDAIRRMWRGESLSRRNGQGDGVDVSVYPRPVAEPPLWLTCSSNPQRFIDAGTRGFNLLTALLFQTPEELAERISLYRAARQEAGFDPDAGRVTLMMHTYVGKTETEIDAAAGAPLKRYLESSVDLWRQKDESLASLSHDDREQVLDYAARRYRQHSALIGTVDDVSMMLKRVKQVGVDEVACLVDFGVAADDVVSSLERLTEVKQRSAAVARTTAGVPVLAAEPENSDRDDFIDALCDLVKSNLNVSTAIDPDAPLLSLGLDSIHAVQLSSSLSELIGKPIGAAFWFDHPTVRRAAEALVRPGAESVHETETDLLRDSRLPVEIQARQKPSRSPGEGPLLLTGATGFLGAFLLRQLLDDSGQRILCLIRAANAERGKQRLLGNLETYGLARSGDADRIVAVVGDLGAPGLGLKDGELDCLAERVSAIVHNGAVVHFAKPYKALRSPNVLGTVDILRLACRGAQVIPVHFVSTMAVFSRAYAGSTVHPEDRPEDYRQLDMGYSRSKWVAERLIQQAVERGIPATIHRPGLLTGCADTGACHSTNFIWNLVKASLQAGVMPDYDRIIDMTPVDWAARHIARATLDASSAGGIFHLANPQPTSLYQIRDFFVRQGYELALVPFEHWQIRIMQRIVSDETLKPLLPVISLAASEFYERKQVRHDSPRVAAAFERLGDPCPAANDRLLKTYHSAFLNAGFLAPVGLTVSRTPPQLPSVNRLHELVYEVTGIADLGDNRWKAPLERLLEDMRQQNYKPGGVERASARLLLGLIRKARVTNLVSTRQEVGRIALKKPVFIVAPPRTGTTLLHNLMSADPAHRAFTLSELFNPVAPKGAPDSWADHMNNVASAFVNETYERSPTLQAIHPLEATAPDECQWLLSSHASLVNAVMAYAPGYASWVLDDDMTDAYRFHQQALQALMWRRPGGRFIGKDPWHLWHLDTLLNVYPDATIIQLHRDMADVVPSMCSLANALQAVEAEPVAPQQWGNFCLDLLHEGLQRVEAVRTSHSAHFIDVSYEDLVSNPAAEMERVYAALGSELSAEAQAGMRDWMAKNPPGKHGQHRYSLSAFGLSRADIQHRFEPYQRNFTGR